MTDNKNRSRVNRRQVLSIGAASGLVAGIAPQIQGPAQAQAKPMPTVEIASLTELNPGTQIDFEYPDENSPAVLLAMDGPVEDGIGPDQNIVAFSSLCTHKGCNVVWHADQKVLICPCHWSSFDPGKKGRMVIGQASSGLPQITLAVEGGKVKATGVSGLIYGRQTNVI